MSEVEKSQQEIANGDEAPSGLTRRQWLLRLGEAAALAGFSGISDLHAANSEAPAAADLRTATSSASAVALPPGLYDASAGHLTHVLMRDQRFVTPPRGSETEYARLHPDPFVPAFFTADEFPVVRRLAWLILNGSFEQRARSSPASDEAVDEVAQWIDLAVSQSAAVRERARHLSAPHRALAVRYYGREEVEVLETFEPQKIWRDGLAWLHQQAAPIASNGFLHLPETQQTALLKNMIPSGGEAQAEFEDAGSRLGRLLKRQVIEGYYTSPAGLKEIDYQGNAFHGESPGCPEK